MKSRIDSQLLLSFVIRSMAIFVLLTIPWPGFKDAFAEIFQAGARGLLQVVMPKEVILVTKNKDSSHTPTDTIIAIRRPLEMPVSSHAAKIVILDSRSLGWMPMAMVLALVGATPLPCKYRWGAMMIGLLAVSCFVVLSVWVSVHSCVSEWNSSEGRNLFFVYANHLLIQNLWLSFLFPTLVWLNILVLALPTNGLNPSKGA